MFLNHHQAAVPLTTFRSNSKLIQYKFALLWFKMWSTDHNEIVNISRQCYCRDVCNILLWAAKWTMNKSMTKFRWISNSVEVSLLWRATGFPIRILVLYIIRVEIRITLCLLFINNVSIEVNWSLMQTTENYQSFSMCTKCFADLNDLNTDKCSKLSISQYFS